MRGRPFIFTHTGVLTLDEPLSPYVMYIRLWQLDKFYFLFKLIGKLVRYDLIVATPYDIGVVFPYYGRTTPI